MNEPATALFSILHKGVRSYTERTASSVRAVVGAEALTTEQHKALEQAIESELESFVWFILGRFDDVGCSLPETILGYRIMADTCTLVETGELQELPEVDISEDGQDYANMWRDYLTEREQRRL